MHLIFLIYGYVGGSPMHYDNKEWSLKVDS